MAQLVVLDLVADPEGVKGIHLNAFLRPNYFIFIGIFKKKLGKISNTSEPPFQKAWIFPGGWGSKL